MFADKPRQMLKIIPRFGRYSSCHLQGFRVNLLILFRAGGRTALLLDDQLRHLHHCKGPKPRVFLFHCRYTWGLRSSESPRISKTRKRETYNTPLHFLVSIPRIKSARRVSKLRAQPCGPARQLLSSPWIRY